MAPECKRELWILTSSFSSLFRIVRFVLPVEFDAAGNPVIFARENVIFAEREAFPVVGAENAPQVGMAWEIDSQQVIGLALVPIRGGPEIGHRRNARVVARREDLDGDRVA